MFPAAISARIRRLEELALGVLRELQQIERRSDIFLWQERLEYRYALLKMCRSLENARVALAKARQRMAGGPTSEYASTDLHVFGEKRKRPSTRVGEMLGRETLEC
jgi:hypothetical protein